MKPTCNSCAKTHWPDQECKVEDEVVTLPELDLPPNEVLPEDPEVIVEPVRTITVTHKNRNKRQ